MAPNPPSGLSAYLDQLDVAHRSRFIRLAQAVDTAIGEPPAATSAFVFRASGGRHPIHPNAREVFWTATEQLMFGSPEGAGELPLLFVGYLAKARRSLLRVAQGFLLTDWRLIARDESPMFADALLARSYSIEGPMPLDRATDAATIVAHAWRSFSNRSFERLAAISTAAELQRLLTLAVAAVIRRRAELAADSPTEAPARQRLRHLATG